MTVTSEQAIDYFTIEIDMTTAITLYVFGPYWNELEMFATVHILEITVTSKVADYISFLLTERRQGKQVEL